MQMKPDRRVERELRTRRELPVTRIHSALKSAEASIRDDLDDESTEDALFDIGDLATPVLWRGHRLIARGDVTGWTDVLEYCWARTAIYEKGGIRSAYSASEIAPAFLMRLAIHGWASDLRTNLRGLQAVLRNLKGAERDDLHLPFFTGAIAELMSTGKTKATGPDGPLRRLASKMTGPIAPKGLMDACEFQLRNSGATEKDGVEFVNFELDPVWWFALARARKGLGLDTPVPDHPLFSTPFAKLPEKLTFDPKKSALLKRVGEIAKLLK